MGCRTYSCEAGSECNCATSPASILLKAKAKPLVPVCEAMLQQYAHRAGTDQGSFCYVVQVLSVRRIIYGKQSPGIPPETGDCGQTTNLQLGTGVYAGKIAGYVKAGSGATVAATEAAGLGAGAIAGAASIVSLAALPFAIWGLFSAHHAVAVAREQGTLCEVAVAWNQFEAGMEAALAAGKIDLKTAQQQVQSAVVQLAEAMKPIHKTCNFACGMTYAVRALGLYVSEIVYPAISKQAPLLSASGLKQNWREILAGGAVAVVGVTQV